MTTDKIEPSGAASPIGNSVSVYIFAAKYDMGMRTSTMDKALCIKDI